MALATAVLTCKGDLVVSYNEAEELVIYDMQAKRVISRLRKPSNALLLEEILEDFDPWVIFSEDIPADIVDAIRDMGIKVQLVKGYTVEGLISELFV
ncbi:MAG: hypothetical protein QXK88_04775 [Desulfurococcaceae archaeon]